MKRLFSGKYGDIHKERMANAANTRWNNELTERSALILTKPPIILSNRKKVIS